MAKNVIEAFEKFIDKLDNIDIDLTGIRFNREIINAMMVMNYWINKNSKSIIVSNIIWDIIIEYYKNQESPKVCKYVDIEITKLLEHIDNKFSYCLVKKRVNKKEYPYSFKLIEDRIKEDSINATIALELEKDRYTKESIKKWKEIFGDKFPNYRTKECVIINYEARKNRNHKIVNI